MISIETKYIPIALDRRISLAPQCLAKVRTRTENNAIPNLKELPNQVLVVEIELVDLCKITIIPKRATKLAIKFLNLIDSGNI